MRKLSMEELNRISVEDFKSSHKIPVIIVLDNIRSQHNIGSVFRTADAFRVEAIYLCGITATPPNREIHKSALGATDSVKWKYYEETITALHELKQQSYRIIAIEQTDSSTTLEDFHPETNKSIVLVFGNEVNGIDDNVLKFCDESIEIPQFGTKHSFNISVTAGIVLWQTFISFEKK